MIMKPTIPTALVVTKPSLFTRFFTAHPHTVGESYWQHFLFACQFAALLLFAATAAFFHALFPALCQTTASDIIKRLATKMDNRSNHTSQ